MLKKSLAICVDDSELIRTTVTKVLKAILPISSEILTYDNYESLIEFLKHNKTDVKFIICDHFVPRMNGLEFCEWIYNFDKNVPLIILTGSSNSEILEKYRQYKNVKTIINKPASIGILKEKISSVLC